ncbi:spidroin-2-like [Hyaena hyaena]|uniref:spidroin-2-like n=1 Tax=Hyaena hyaena TaxID=95912 RepID=UPI001921C3F0|nr:spidroin-2-like [Hyaena hyaena]
MSGGNAQSVGRPGDNAQIWGKLGAMPSRSPGRGRSTAHVLAGQVCWGNTNLPNPSSSGAFVGEEQRSETRAPLRAGLRAGREQCPNIGNAGQSSVWFAAQSPNSPTGALPGGTRAQAGSAGDPEARAPEGILLLSRLPSGPGSARAAAARRIGRREEGRKPRAARARLGRGSSALPGLRAPRSAASEDGPALPAAAAPHALPRCEPRRSRGRAAAAGRLVPGSAWGPWSTPDGHPRAPGRSAGAAPAFPGPQTRAKPIRLGAGPGEASARCLETCPCSFCLDLGGHPLLRPRLRSELQEGCRCQPQAASKGPGTQPEPPGPNSTSYPGHKAPQAADQ